MRKRLLILATLAIALLAFAPALADGHDACGGSYPAAVEVAAVDLPDGYGVDNVSFCSDGAIDWVVPTTGDGTSSCGGAYAAAVEIDEVQLPDGAPLQAVSFCSDGTLQELGL